MSALDRRLDGARRSRAAHTDPAAPIPRGLRPPRPTGTRWARLALALAAGGAVGLLLAHQDGPEPVEVDLLSPPEGVASGPEEALAEPAATSRTPARLHALHARAAGHGLELRLQFDAPVGHRLEVQPDGRRLTLWVPGADLADRPRREGLFTPPLATLEAQRMGEDLRLEIGLRTPSSVIALPAPGSENAVLLEILPWAELAPDAHQAAAPEPSPSASPASPTRAPARPESAPPASLAPAEEDAYPTGISPSGADAAYAQGVHAHERGRIDEAIDAFRSAISARPDHAGARERLARLLIARGDRAAALDVVRRGAELDPRAWRFTELEARLLADTGDDAAALAALARADLSRAPASLHGLRGALLQRGGDHAGAIAAYTEAVRRDPDRATAWLGLAISLEARQQTAGSARALRAALAGNGLTPAARAWAQEQLGRLEATP